MATITQKQNSSNNLGAAPDGNLTALHYVLDTNATGAAINSNSTAAIALGDVVRLGVLPAGFKLIDSQVVVQTGMSASVTGSLGFAYTDGVDVTATPQDADYFGAGLALSSAARLRNATTNSAVTLPKDAYLTLTTAGAANAKESHVEVTVLAVIEGVA